MIFRKHISLLIFLLLLIAVSCGKRRKVIEQETFRSENGGVAERVVYTENDSFYIVNIENRITVSRITTLSRETYKDSTFRYEEFYPEKKPRAVQFYEHGKPVNTWKSWYANGQLQAVSEYDNHTLRHYQSWYDNGKLQAEGTRHPNGKLFRIEQYYNGNLKEKIETDSLGNGKCTYYYFNGIRKEEGKLRNYLPSGVWQKFDTLGVYLKDTLYGI